MALDQSDSSSPALEQVVLAHARERFAHNYDIREVVSEYQLLRRTIMDAHASTRSTEASADLTLLNEVVDLAIGASVDFFMAERDRARDIFVGILGHDLRGPLQSIIAAAEIFAGADEPTPVIRHRAGVRLRTSAHRMGEMIDGLLDFARTHFSGGIPIDAHPLDVRELLHDVVEEISIANAERSINLSTIEASADMSASADATRLAQAITNLVRNAIEHGRGPIVVAPEDEGATIRIDVSSVGTIAPDVASRLFTPFAHTNPQSKARVRSGLGLGLFIVAEIARAHGGAAWLAGTTEDRVVFSFRIQKQVSG